LVPVVVASAVVVVAEDEDDDDEDGGGAFPRCRVLDNMLWMSSNSVSVSMVAPFGNSAISEALAHFWIEQPDA